MCDDTSLYLCNTHLFSLESPRFFVKIVRHELLNELLLFYCYEGPLDKVFPYNYSSLELPFPAKKSVYVEITKL